MATDNEQQEVKGTKVQSSATVGAELTQAARRKRYEELRARIGRSRLEVKNGKKGKHYFWAAREDQAESIRLEGLGYEIVKEPNAKKVLAGEAKPLIEAQGLKEDGTYVVGDVILMMCDDEVYEFIQMDVSERHEALIEGAVADFTTEAAKSGVPTFQTEGRR
jgi:hypothetical protein